MLQWINGDNLINISVEDYLNNDERMTAVAEDFFYKLNILIYCLSDVVVGWLTRNCTPSLREDRILVVSLP